MTKQVNERGAENEHGHYEPKEAVDWFDWIEPNRFIEETEPKHAK